MDNGQLHEAILEFLDAFVHQVLFTRELYSATLFQRKRLYGIAVRRARHPELCDYIADVVRSLKASILFVIISLK